MVEIGHFSIFIDMFQYQNDEFRTNDYTHGSCLPQPYLHARFGRNPDCETGPLMRNGLEVVKSDVCQGGMQFDEL